MTAGADGGIINGNESAGNINFDEGLMEVLAESGVKYEADDVVMVTKNSDGKLLWLEKGNGSSGFEHIVNGHATDFSAEGVQDIPSFLYQVLNSDPIKTGTGAKGPFSEYTINGSKYRVAYGSNGYIVSFYPID